MSQEYDKPIAPPPELVQQWLEFSPAIAIAAAFQAGADQELEACCKWLPKLPPWSGDDLRRHRRPKPPSLKEEALQALNDAVKMADDVPPEGICSDQADIIRRALETLPE
jgi:hypothetical protein